MREKYSRNFGIWTPAVEARSTALHARDRSAIYGGFHLYHLKGTA